MKRHTFPHGIHPPELKHLTESKDIETVPAPETLVIPLHQHFGKPAKPLVEKGDDIFLGQKIAESDGLFSASVHSSVSGKVKSIDPFSHPGGSPVPAVTVINDGEDRTDSKILKKEMSLEEVARLSSKEILEKVKEAGVVGMGGAAFPTAVKLNPPSDKPIDCFILNGCECEPMLTADDRLMQKYPHEIIKGAELACKATGAKRIIIGIEDNKKKAYALFCQQVKNCPSIFLSESERPFREVALLKTKYPQGAEKNLIYALLKREVPRGGLPFDVGTVVQNVATSKAIWDAVSRNRPLYERIVTVSGSGVNETKNVSVRIGTPIYHVLDFCGGIKEDANLLIIGGPMMGIVQWTTDVPVIKGTSGIITWKVSQAPLEFSCIRCSRCVDHCPMRLVPTQLAKLVKYDHLSEAESWGILDCVECGSCQYICPSKIPLVQWLRLGKTKIISKKRKKSA
ncbi:MAG: electron transport complex subunit RsxC [Candidatus Aminicenantes bacterium]|nr:electron transport complex subunit RsxC [Candidatus Aminicenantes bacterium]